MVFLTSFEWIINWFLRFPLTSLLSPNLIFNLADMPHYGSASSSCPRGLFKT